MIDNKYFNILMSIANDLAARNFNFEIDINKTGVSWRLYYKDDSTKYGINAEYSDYLYCHMNGSFNIENFIEDLKFKISRLPMDGRYM